MNHHKLNYNTSLVMSEHELKDQMNFGSDRTVVPGKRVGVIGLDTSHSVEFTKLLNAGVEGMEGYRVVAAYPHGTREIEFALKQKAGNIEAVRGMGVTLVDSIDELLQEVDVVLLESNDGRVHFEQAIPVFKSGKRVFIDKPLAHALDQAQAIFQAAKEYNVPVFSSSAMRFDANVEKVVAGAIGSVIGADVHTPATIFPGHLDLAWYGVHGAEMLFAVMGPDCLQVSRTHTEGTDVVVGVWSGGRIGTLRAIREGAARIAGTAFGQNGIAELGPFTSYQPLVREIVKFFETGTPPVTEKETMAIFKFMNAAQESRKEEGKIIML